MRIGFIVIVIIFCSISASLGAKVNGYFITNDGDTIHTVFRVPGNLLSTTITFEKLQWKIRYTDKNNQAYNLMPEHAREFFFTFKGSLVRFLSRENTLKASNSGFNPAPKIFLRLIVDGNLKLFKFYQYSGFTDGDPGSPDPVLRESPGWSEVSILQKDNAPLFEPRIASFRKDMRNYLSDCPKLAEKIKNRTLKSEDLKQIVEEYNEMCMP